MSKKFRIVQVGCGGITGAWFNAGTKMENVEYVGLVDLNPKAAQHRKDEYGLDSAQIFTDLATALETTHPDAIFDCTIPSAHTPTAIMALEHGVHVLSEKPMSDTVENAQRALDASRNFGRLYTITQNYRYSVGPRQVKAFLETGALGAVTTINADMYLGAHFGGFRDEMKHVLLLDMAIHTFDMARYLGGADPEWVFAHEWNPAGSWFAHDASANALFGMTQGLMFSFRGSWCATGLPSDFGSHWRIIGEKGTMLWDGHEDFKVEVENGNEGFIRPVKTLEVPPLEYDPSMYSHGGVIHDFLAAIESGIPSETRAEDNIKSLAMVLGAVQSSERKARVEIAV